MNQNPSGGGNDKEILNNCIGNLEHHVHKVFAAVRVPGEDFVYSASLDLFSKLDDYCDAQFMSEARLPLLIKGESGTGKSALLSNWLQKRERNSKRDEFIFWHAVGCSRQSMNVNSLIRRLIVDLKNRFELSRPIPKSQERLSWELPRFLELVAKRGNTIIVIDGLNRLVNNDNTEDGLAWLPLEFPPHIRVILSVTIPPMHLGSSNSSRPTTPLRDRSTPTHANSSSGLDGSSTPVSRGVENVTPFSAAKAAGNRIDEEVDEDGDKDDDRSIEAAVKAVTGGKADKPVKNKKSRILQELDRRAIPSIVLKPLDKNLCRNLVETFIQKSVNSEAAALATGPYITTFMSAVKQLAATQEGVDLGNTQIAGFLMFENQINALLNHQQGGTPLFLRLFLRCLQYAVSRGFSLWHLYEDWMQANSVPALLIRILQTLEEGSVRHRNSAQEACDKTIAAGGLPALREIYSWHPSFQVKPESEQVTTERTNSPLPDVDFSKLRPRTGESFSAAAGAGGEGGGASEGNVLINANRRAPASVSIELLKSAISNQTTPTVVTHTAVSMEDIQLVSEAEANNNDKSSSNGQGQNPLSTSVSQNLGDQQWVSVAEQVHKKLQLAIASSNKLIEDTLNNAKQTAVQRNTDYVTALVQNIRSLHIQYAEANNRTLDNWDTPAEKPAMRDVLSNVKRQRTRVHSTDLSVSTKGEDRYADDEYSATLSDSDVDSLDESVDVDGAGSLPPTTSPSPGPPGAPIMTPGGMGQQPRDSKFFPKNTFDPVTNRKTSMIENVKPSEMQASPSKHHGSMSRVKSQSKIRSSPSRGSSISEAVSHVKVVDPSEGLTTLPIYLRGGVTTAGFGEILGNALALLYVARQGLHEHELWKILSTLQYKKEKSLRESLLTKEAKAHNNMIIRNLATQVLQSRGELRDTFKADDTGHTGYITQKQMHLCLKKLFPATKRSDLTKLLDFVESNTEDAPAGSDLRDIEADDVKHNPLRMREKVHYMKLISLLVKLNKHFKFGESKVSNMKSNGTSSKESLNMAKQSSHLKKRMASAVIAAGNAPDMHTDDNDYNNFNLKVTSSSAPSGDLLGHTGGLDGTIPAAGGGVNEMYPAGAAHKDGAVDPDDEDDDDGENFTLGPVIEESLLSILAALGVLYSPENKVLILPSDSEPFRKVIFEEYILSRGGRSLHYWHHLIIQYFQTEPNSLRKCEELPWHLKICKKWNTLRDTLVDLKTFDLMFNNDLKDELMEYWLLLTEGPLHVNDPNAHTTDKANMRISFMAGGGLPVGGSQKEDDESTAAGSSYSHILRDIDQAMEMKVSVKDARKKLFKNQLQPFDVVEELNKSLEAWVTTTRPSPLQVHKTITQISKFLAEFSKVMSQTPTFQRIGIDLASLQMFGVSLEDVKEYLTPVANATATALLGDAAGAAAAGADDSNGLAGGKSPHQNRGSKSGAAGATAATSKDSESDGYFENSAKEQAPKFPTPQMITSSLYPFLRWIWMQFPWIALYPAATLYARTNALTTNSADHDNGAGVSTPDTSTPSTLNSDTARLLRVWNCKKSDPTVPVFNLSSNRKLAAIKPRTSLSQSLERNVEIEYRAIYEELTAPSLIAKVKLGVGLHKDKFRRSYEEELAANKNIPFAYHGARITKSESLFPSYKAFISNSNKEKLRSEYNLDDGAGSKNNRKRLAANKPLPKFNLQDALSAGGIGGTFMTELDNEIQKMGKEEFVQNHKVDRASGTLIVDENDLEYEASLSRIERMKTIRNKLSIITRAKMNIIADLDNQISIRNESDAQLISEVNASELLIKSLNERNLVMDANMEEARQLHEGYTELLRVLKNNPPYIESHVQALEVEVDLANRQFEDLCAHRKSLYEEADRLDTHKRKQLQDRINYYANARKDVAAKKKQVQREMKHMRDPHAYDGGGSGRHIASHRKNHMDNDSDSSVGSVDSADDESQAEEEVKDIALTKPVIHFINALVRKQTFGEGIVKEGDKTLDDVKHRVKNTIVEPPKLVTTRKKHQRQGSSSNLNALKSDSGSLNGEDKLSELPSGGGGGPGVPFGHANVIAGFGGKRKFSKEQQAQMKESLRSISAAGGAAGGGTGGGTSHSSPHEKESFKGAVQKTMMFLFERTESSNVDEFIERFLQGQKLLDAMKNQQMLVDSKVVQLGKDKIELEKELEAIAFRDGGNDLPGGTGELSSHLAPLVMPTAEELEEDRYLDDQLFKKEVALHQLQRKYDAALHLISEVQTSITHVMNMLVINNKLLSVLPKSQPPVIKNDGDIFAAIMWCEDRIMALNEALAMDANRPNGATAAEENMPMFKRQVELAELINEMQKLHQKKIRSLNTTKQAKKQSGGLAKGLIATGDKGTFVSSPRGIVVTPMNKIDKIFDSKMEKVIAKRDKMNDAYESSMSYDAKKETRVDITKFLSESLAKNLSVTKDLSRKANQLQNKRQGRHMTYGLVLDGFLAASGQSMEDGAAGGGGGAGGVNNGGGSGSVVEGKDGGAAGGGLGVTAGGLNTSTVMNSSMASVPNVSVGSPTNSVK